jgi:hypothetical protein
MPTFHAPENSLFRHFYFTSFNAKGESLYKRLSHLVPCRFNNPSESLP